MGDIGINFSWGYVGAVVLGAFVGFFLGEVVERGLRDFWAGRTQEMSSRMPKRDLTKQRISQTAINSK